MNSSRRELEQRNIRVEAGLVREEEEEEEEEGWEVVDCRGLLVLPGLIDLHVHVYHDATVLGVEPDSACLARGVTTVLDGGSAGAMTFGGLRRFVMEPSQTRVLAWLHIACHGLAGAACSGEEFGPGGEVDSVNVVKTELCVKTIRANRERIVGVKARLDRNISNNGENESFVLRQALLAAREAAVPLMVHHTNSSLSLEEVLESLSPGDVYTHSLSQMAGEGRGILDQERRTVRPCVLQARARGVIFDVGHGQGSFSWEIAEVCARAGFYPDTVSTDLHSGNVDGLARDLPWVMSKFLHLGGVSPSPRTTSQQ